MNFKLEIEKLIDSNLKTYRDNSDRFIADYNRELELTKEYNGRQLLELLQNADDAGSEEVEIVWDKGAALLSMSNKGEAFSVGGIKSLMLANLSTKTKISYIGNKGLGFRSILNWAEHINIFTNGCKISFSEVIAKDIFENELNLTENDKKRLREERNLSQYVVPFPTLGVPKVEEEQEDSPWTTRVEISCAMEFENNIEKQLSEIREEILLFLNNIRKITIRNNGSESFQIESIKKELDGYEIVMIKEKSWRVFTKENVLPLEFQDKSKNEQQSYNLKVAFQDDLSDDYKKLFNFFPTQLSIMLPCIIHGTFELNSSRNHLNESKKNEYILTQLVELLKECSLFLTKDKIDWRPYKILTPSASSSDSKLIEVFYHGLEELKKTESIYPCINNEYKTLNNVFYYSDEFDTFFMQYFPIVLPGLLIPRGHEVTNKFEKNKYEHEDLVNRIDDLSYTDISIPLRAELIAQLAQVVEFNNDATRFSLLINDSEKVISKDVVAFTPRINSLEKFEIPRLVVDIDFINYNLYEPLFKRFENEYDNSEKDKRRELQRIIKSVVNLQPYDSTNVTEKIISGSKDALKSTISDDDQINCIREMATALYANFNNISNKLEKLKISVPLISKSRKIVNASDLFLSKTYPAGVLTEIIYKDTLKANEYLAEIDYWGFENEETALVESFFLWLGINKYSRLKTIQLRENWQETPFIEFLFSQDAESAPDFHVGRISKDSTVTGIANFDQILTLPLNCIILLALKDAVIRRNLEQNDQIVQWLYSYWRTLASEYSYIRYQFINAKVFTKYIIEEGGGEDLNKLINENFQIDYGFLSTHGINKTEVKSILLKLGAKESFNELLPENVYEILSTIPKKDISKKGESTQTIYKMALDSLVKQKSKFPVPVNIEFFSRQGGEKSYKPNNEIYYAENSTLPRKILDTLYLLNLPKRSGADNVFKYFNVKSIGELKIKINTESIKLNTNFNTIFNNLFESIKPYLLAYRLNSPNLRRKIAEEGKKREDEARAIKDCKIVIVNECLFSFSDKENVPVGEQEYVNVGNCFYYRDNFISSSDYLKRDSAFCDAFAEMMCIVFKVNDLKNDFRQILKNDVQDTIHLAKQDVGNDKIEESFQLLGVSRIEIDFWKNVFALKGKRLFEPVENTEDLKKQIQQVLGIILIDEYNKVDFENFNNKDSFELIKQLCDNLSLSVKQILPGGLYIWHKLQFTNTVKDFEYKFKQLTWYKLNADPQVQSAFISLLNKYNLSFINSIEDEIQTIKYDLFSDYLNRLKNLITLHFKINLDDEFIQSISIINLYGKLLNKYSVEETDISDESMRSLLYFEDNDEIIETYLKEHFNSHVQGDSGKIDNGPTILGSIVDASLIKNSKLISTNGLGNKGRSWVHSEKVDRNNKRTGKLAETLVYNTLVNKYGSENVKWVSGNSTTPDKNDKLHYDIEYKNMDGEWRYLEVKAMSDNQFIISSSEKEKGLSEPDKYEMALVSENTIYMVKDIFKFENGETFENNPKFFAYPKDYIFSFKVSTLNMD
ncbi:MAG: DUF3883 domain-containing protein [Bacteroidota bacterium]